MLFQLQVAHHFKERKKLQLGSSFKPICVEDDPFRDLNEEELFECLNIAFRAEQHGVKKAKK